MSIHKPADRHFIVIGGAVNTQGRSLKLAKGQFGIFEQGTSNKDGLRAVSSFAGKPKRTKYELRLGVSDREVTRSQHSKAFSSFPFEIGEVEEVRVSAPTRTEQEVDEVVIGYNGLDPNSSMDFDRTERDRAQIMLRLSGTVLGYLGYERTYVDIPVDMFVENCPAYNDCVNCDPCESVDPLPLVLQAIDRLKQHQLRGNRKLTEFVEITPVIKCDTDTSVNEIDYTFYNLTVADVGDEKSLALVQAQYPDYKVARIDRVGANSTYQILVPASEAAPAAYAQTIASVLKGCEDCPAGFTEVTGGVLYSLTLEDDGTDQTALVQGNFPNAVAASAEKGDAQLDGVGYYTVLASQKATEAELAAFLGTNAVSSTARISLVGTVEDICDNGTVSNTAWVAGDTCNITQQGYKISLPDNKCGESRLAELQARYPDYTIYEGEGQGSRDITLTGTNPVSSTANVNVAGTDYLATFDTDLTTTANNFVTDHSAAILTATGIVVTANAGVLSFSGDITLLAGLSIENVSGDLDGTVSSISATAVAGGCQRYYFALVNTNLVCAECDPVFEDTYTSEKPDTFSDNQWEAVDPSVTPSGCKAGIRFKGKVMEIHPEDCLRFDLGFEDVSVKLQVSGGHLREVRANEHAVERPFKVTKLNEFKHRTHLGGNFWQFELESHQFFRGEQVNEDYLYRMLKKQETHIDPTKQYVDYELVINRPYSSGGYGGKVNDRVSYHVLAEVGKHEEVENLVNLIANAAGLPSVQAFAKD